MANIFNRVFKKDEQYSQIHDNSSIQVCNPALKSFFADPAIRPLPSETKVQEPTSNSINVINSKNVIESKTPENKSIRKPLYLLRNRAI